MESEAHSPPTPESTAIVPYKPFLPHILQEEFEERVIVLPGPCAADEVQEGCKTYTRRPKKRTCKLDLSRDSSKSKSKKSSSSKPVKSDLPRLGTRRSSRLAGGNVALSTKQVGKRPREESGVVDIEEISDDEEESEEIEELFVYGKPMSPKDAFADETEEMVDCLQTLKRSEIDETVDSEEEEEESFLAERRRKFQLQAFMDGQFLQDFFLEESKIRFDDLYADKGFLVEQPFSIDAPTVFSILESNGLENCISISGKYNKTLVSEFYANCGSRVGEKSSPFYHKVFVRGVWVSFSPLSINDVLGSPYDPSDYSPELSRPHITPSEVVQTLTHGKVQEWTGSLLPASRLTATFALLNKLCKSQWTPSSHLSNLTLREAMLLFVLASDKEQVNLGNVIFENILDRAVENKQRKMTHPVLISRLLKKQSVPSRETDDVATVPSSLTSNKRLCSGNRVNDLPQSPPPHRLEGKQAWVKYFKQKVAEAVNDCHNMKVRLTSLMDELDELG